MWSIPPSAHLLPGVLLSWSTVSMFLSPSPRSSAPSPRSLSLPPPLSSLLLSSTVCSCLLRGMLFINLTMLTVDNCQKPLTLQCHLWWYFCVSRRAACACACRGGGKRCSWLCCVSFCAAGLVCMKSSTSVVELVMLLCSQVGNSSPLLRVSLCIVLHTYGQFCQSLKKKTSLQFVTCLAQSILFHIFFVEPQ